MNPVFEYHQLQNRRQFFQGAGLKLGGLALAQIAGQRALAAAKTEVNGDVHPSLPGFPHFAPKAKRIIMLFNSGGPSHIDTFDYKPVMNDFHGEELPESVRDGQRLTTMTSGQKAFPGTSRRWLRLQGGGGLSYCVCLCQM